jgi:hypothetical protein
VGTRVVRFAPAFDADVHEGVARCGLDGIDLIFNLIVSRRVFFNEERDYIGDSGTILGTAPESCGMSLKACPGNPVGRTPRT